MSFEVRWERMETEFAKEVEQLLTKVLNGQEKKPDFLGRITVSDFSFGDVPPEIVVVDITEPYEEFYMQMQPLVRPLPPRQITPCCWRGL